jgi:hypothetical protein
MGAAGSERESVLVQLARRSFHSMLGEGRMIPAGSLSWRLARPTPLVIPTTGHCAASSSASEMRDVRAALRSGEPRATYQLAS